MNFDIGDAVDTAVNYVLDNFRPHWISSQP